MAPAEPLSVQVTDQDGNPVENATVEVWNANEDEIEKQMGVKADELNETAEDLLADARTVEPESFDADRDLLEDDAALGDVDGEAVLVHDASEWDLAGYETRSGLISRDVAPNLGLPDTVHSSEDRIVVSVWDIGSSSFSEDDVDESVDGAQTVPEEREIVIEQLDGETEIDDRVVDTREFVEVTDATANVGTKTHYAASVDVPRGFYKVYVKGESHKATYHVVGDPTGVATAIEDDLKDEANAKTARAQEITDNLNDGIFQRQYVTTNATGHATIEGYSGNIAIQAYRTSAPNADPGNQSLTEIRELHKSEEYLGTMYYSPTPVEIDTRDVSEGEVVDVGVIRSGEIPQQDMDLNDKQIGELIDYIENETDVLDHREISGDVDDLEATRDTLRTIVESNSEAEETLVDAYPEHATHGQLDLRDVSTYDSDAAAYADHINALRFALDRTPSAYDTESSGEIENDTLDMRLSTGGVLDGADVSDVEVLVHWQDGTTEPVSGDYWHVESGAGGDAIVVEDYPVPSDKAHATIEVLAEADNGEIVKGSTKVKNPAYSGDHLSFESLVASTLTPGPDETVTVTPTLEDSGAEIVGATVTTPAGNEVNANVSGGAVTFDTDGAGAHVLQIEYNESGSTWIKTARINAREAGLDTPPAIHEAGGDDTHALATGLEGAEISEEAGGTQTRMTAVIKSDGRAPGIVHYHPDLDSSEESLKLEVKAGEYRETVSNRVSMAVHVSLSDDAIVWVDGVPVTRDGSTAVGEIQETEDGEIIRATTDEDAEATVRIVQDPRLRDRISHSISALLSAITVDVDGDVPTSPITTAAATIGADAATQTEAAL